jgi:hypothetical protein
MVKLKYYVIFGFILFLITKFPDWKKNKNSKSYIDWSTVVDDPNEHLLYDLLDVYEFSLGKLDSSSFVKKLLEKRFNITLNHKPYNYYKYQNFRSFSLVAGDIPDLFVQNSTSLNKAAKHGFICPVPIEIIVKYAPTYAAMVQKNAPYGWTAAMVDGYQYGIPLVKSYPFPRVGIWRKDWLDAVGINRTPDTIEDYTNALNRFRNEKPDAKSFIAAFGVDLDESQKKMVLDNAKPTWGMGGDIGVWRYGMFTDIFGAYGVQPFNWIFDNGELKWGGIQVGARNALEQLNTWYKDGYIHPDFVTDLWYMEGLQKLYSSNVGYIAFWSNYTYNHIDNDIPKTMARLQYDRDIKLLINIGKTESEARELVIEKSDRYINLWTPARVPIGPGGHRGIRGDQDLLLGFRSILSFGRQIADEPEKIIRWLIMMETILNDEELMVSCGLGIEELHWRWQKPGEIKKNIIDQEDASGMGQVQLTFVTDPESVVVAMEPYGTSFKRSKQGLHFFLESGPSRYYSGTLVYVPVPESIRKKYISKTQVEWEKKYTPKEWADKCIFGDAEQLVPGNIITQVKGLIAYQQMAYAKFITGERWLNDWDQFVYEFESRGGIELRGKMIEYYDQIITTEKKVDSLIHISSVINNG